MNATRNSNGERTTLGKQIKTFFGATTDTTRRPDRRRARFQLEGLEQRRVMTTTATALGELVTQIQAATIAPAVAKQVIAGVQLVGLKNSSAVVSTVLSSSNVASVLKQSGLGTVAVTQNLISDTSADVTQILQKELSSNPNLFAPPVITVPVSSSPVVKTAQPLPVTPTGTPTASLSALKSSIPSSPAISPPISWTPAVKISIPTTSTPVTTSSLTSEYTQELAQANQNKSNGMDYVVPTPPPVEASNAEIIAAFGLKPTYGTVTPPSLAKPATPVNVLNLPNTLSGADQLVAQLKGS